MSTRERWIVYPLLFLALGTSIKPKLTSPELRGTSLPASIVRVGELECETLSILGPDDKPRVTARAVGGSGVIQVIDDKGRAVVLRADDQTWFLPHSKKSE